MTLNRYKYILLILLAVVSLSCSQTQSDNSSSQLQPFDPVTIDSHYTTVHAGSQTQQVFGSSDVLSQAQANNYKLMWVQSALPKLNSYSGDVMIENAFEINGQIYVVPTVHPRSSTGDRPGISEVYEVQDFNIEVESICLDQNCTEYVLSVVLYQDNKAMIQNLVYVDFAGYNDPVFKANSGRSVSSLKNFISYYLNFSPY